MDCARFIVASSICCPRRAIAQDAPGHRCPRLIEFSGDQGDPTDVQLPHVSGRVLIYYWSELEPKENRFDFATMDREIGAWTGSGKTVVLRFSTAGWRKWKQPRSQQSTPRWAIRNITSARSRRSIAQYFRFTGALEISPELAISFALFRRTFRRARIAIGWHSLKFAVGDGGETKPDTEQNKTPQQCAARLAFWQKAGHTNALWYAAVARVIEIYKNAFPATPLALMPDATFLGGDCTLPKIRCRECSMVELASKAEVILQDNGFDRTKHYAKEWHEGRPLTCEQLRSATKQGYVLEYDLNHSVKARCGWRLVFRQDLERSDFQKQVSKFYRRCPK